MKQGKLVLGILAGLATGAVLGLLLAPDKGSKTRKQIKHKGEHYLDELKVTYEKMANKLAKKGTADLAEVDEIYAN